PQRRTGLALPDGRGLRQRPGICHRRCPAMHAGQQGRPHPGGALSESLRPGSGALDSHRPGRQQSQRRSRSRPDRYHRLWRAIHGRVTAERRTIRGMTRLRILRPDDWHLHVRDGAQLASVLPFTARQFARAIIMPNLKPPVTTVAMAAAYRDRVLAALPAGALFEPLMTLYLTDTTSPQEIRAARSSGFIFGAKLYPANATTHSDASVTAIEKIYPTLEAMQDCGLVFQVHSEMTDGAVDVFDRERVFIDRILTKVVERFPTLRVVFEHVTTREAVEFVKSARRGVGATITPQHLLLNRNAIFQGGIRPHTYCLPVLKREHDRRALLEAATADDPRFFL